MFLDMRFGRAARDGRGIVKEGDSQRRDGTLFVPLRRGASKQEQAEPAAVEVDSSGSMPLQAARSVQSGGMTGPQRSSLERPGDQRPDYARSDVQRPGVQRPNVQRPGLQHRRTTAHTRYIDMLLGLDQVSPFHNILASCFVWILLAGYIVFPATFTSLQKSAFDDKADTRLKSQVLATARNIPLLYVAAVACGVGVLGCVWLWWKHRGNYVWVVNRIFLPSLMNSVAGLVSTLVNVYSAQEGE